MPIETKCPSCGRKLRVGDEHAGKQARCPVCSAVYSVPAASGSAGDASPDLGAGENLSGGTTSSSASSPTAGAGSQIGSSDGFDIQSPASSAAATHSLSDFVAQRASERSGSAGSLSGGSSAGASSSTANAASDNEPVWSMKTPEGHVYGPVTRTEMDRWVSEGRVAFDCHLRRGDEPWTSAESVYPALTARGRQAGGSPNYAATGASAAASASPNVYSDSYRTPGQFAPGGFSGVSGSYATPHRGVLVLIMGILSWVTGCFIFGVVAWVLGAADLREMKAGRMDPSGLGLTQAGYIIGMIHTIIGAIGVLLFLAYIVIVIIVVAAGGA